TTGAAARRAGLRADELAEDAARHLAQPTGAAARGTCRRLGPRLGAVAGAARAGDGDLERDFARRARRGLDELALDARRGVRAATSRRSPRHAEEVVAEERGEEVGEPSEVECRRIEPAA